MGVKKLNNLELINEDYLRTTISEGESIAIVNKNRVFRATQKHFTKINERDDDNIPNTKELYYEISVDDGRELPLDSFRLMINDDAGKQMVLDGILEILLLVSEGKIYDVDLNPLNFIAEDNPDVGRVYIKAFNRRDRGLREITNEWLEDAKKLIGYFLISDTGVGEHNYNDLTGVELYHRMSGAIAEEYLRILKSPSIDRIAREWFTEETYKQLKGFPPIVSDFREPKDVTDVGEIVLGIHDTREAEDYDTDFDEDEFELEEEPVKKGKGKNKLKPILIAVVLFGGLLAGLLVGTKYFNDRVDTIEVPLAYYDGMLKASVQKYKDAGEDFDRLTEEEMEMLGEDEKTTIYVSYLKGGEFDKALRIDPEGAETVVTYLEKRDELPLVLEMESTLAPISFEKAVLNEDYAAVIELKSEVRDTEKRQENLVEALVKTGDVDLAVDYVKEKGMEKMEKKVRQYYESYQETLEEGEKADKEELKRVDKLIKSLPK